MTGTWASGWATGDIVTAAEFKKGVGAIFDTTLGGAAANIDVTSISATYAHLLLTLYSRSDAATALVAGLMRFNGDSAANYDYQYVQGQAATASAAESFGASSLTIGNIAGNTAGANLFGTQEIFIPHYAGASNNKGFIALSANKIGVATTNITVNLFGGSWRSNAAINRITLLPGSGSFMAGTRLTIYAMGA